MAESSLLSALRGVVDLGLQRSILETRLASGGEERLVGELDAIWRHAIGGASSARNAALGVASWCGHVTGRNEASRLEALGAIATRMDLPLAATLLARSKERAHLLPRGRLAEVCIPPREHFTRWRRLSGLRRPIPSLGPSLHHHDPLYIGRLLDEPWLRESNVVDIAARRPSTADLVMTIVARDRWFARCRVHHAIVANPFSPAPIVLTLLPLAPEAHLREIGRDVETTVGQAAVRVLALREAREQASPLVGFPALPA